MKIQLIQDSPIMFKLIPETVVDGVVTGGLAARCSRHGGEIKRVKLKDDGTLLINVDDDWPDFKEHGEVEKAPLDGMSKRELAHMTIRAALGVQYDPSQDEGEGHGPNDYDLISEMGNSIEALEDFNCFGDFIDFMLDAAESIGKGKK